MKNTFKVMIATAISVVASVFVVGWVYLCDYVGTMVGKDGGLVFIFSLCFIALVAFVYELMFNKP